MITLPFQPLIILIISSFPYHDTNEYKTLVNNCWYFTHTADNKAYILGYMIPSVATALLSLTPQILEHLAIDGEARSISLKATTIETRTEVLAAITNHWRVNKTFCILKKWREEHTPIYAPSGALYATIERASTPLFGLVSYYVYLIAYTVEPNISSKPENEPGKREINIWIQRRALSKASHGGFLDCTVAGAIQTGQTPAESLARESEEEASFPPAITAKAIPVLPGNNKNLNMRISPSGVGDGEMYYTAGCGFGYEIELTKGEIPVPSDGEVSKFYKMSVQEVKERLRREEFTPYAARILVEWLVARGEIPEGDRFKNARKRELVFPLM